MLCPLRWSPTALWLLGMTGSWVLLVLLLLHERHLARGPRGSMGCCKGGLRAPCVVAVPPGQGLLRGMDGVGNISTSWGCNSVPVDRRLVVCLFWLGVAGRGLDLPSSRCYHTGYHRLCNICTHTPSDFGHVMHAQESTDGPTRSMRTVGMHSTGLKQNFKIRQIRHGLKLHEGTCSKSK